MKLRLPHLLTVTFLSFFVYHAAFAGQDDAVDIIQTIQIDSISLNSSAEDIEAYINTKPSLTCKRVDAPERKSKIPSRPSKPRHQSWNCSYAHKTLSEMLNIQMSGGVITYLYHTTGYENAQDFEKTKSYIRGIHKKIEAAGLTSDQTNSQNFMTYKENDGKGGSAPSFSQHLNAKRVVLCDDLPLSFLVSVNANTLPSQDIYRAGIKIERSSRPLACENINTDEKALNDALNNWKK